MEAIILDLSRTSIEIVEIETNPVSRWFVDYGTQARAPLELTVRDGIVV